MQEKEAPVFVIATANNINSLPPELLRKGRFDEIFFVDLPTFKEREDIFKVHLTKRLKDAEISKNVPLEQSTYKKLAELTEGFIGAEIEQVVISALCEAFFENRALDFSDLEKVIKTTVPLSKTQKEQIIALREWANVRAVTATKKEDLSSYSTEDKSSSNISEGRGGRTLEF